MAPVHDDMRLENPDGFLHMNLVIFLLIIYIFSQLLFKTCSDANIHLFLMFLCFA